MYTDQDMETLRNYILKICDPRVELTGSSYKNATQEFMDGRIQTAGSILTAVDALRRDNAKRGSAYAQAIKQMDAESRLDTSLLNGKQLHMTDSARHLLAQIQEE